MINTKTARQALENWPCQYTNADIRLWYEKLLAEIECGNLIEDRWTCGSHEYSKQEYPDGCPYCELENKNEKLKGMIEWLVQFFEWLQSNPPAKDLKRWIREARASMGHDNA